MRADENGNAYSQEVAAALQQSLKREMSQRSVYQLYVVCAEKIMSLCLKDNEEIAKVVLQVFRGLAKIMQRYQRMLLGVAHKQAKAL